MPYKKRYNGKYKRYIKPSMDTAFKALQIALATKRLLNVEKKWHDVDGFNINASQSGTIIQLTNVAQGDTSQTRDGDQLKILSLQLKLFGVRDSVANASLMRVMIVQDSQTNGAIYALSDLLEDASVSNNMLSPANLDNKYRFKIWYDRLHPMIESASNAIKVINKFFNKAVKIRFDNESAVISSLTSNSLSLVVICRQSTNVPTFTHWCRIRYVDN